MTNSQYAVENWRDVANAVYPPRRLPTFELEDAAITTRVFTSHVVPGLLQTESYARTVLRRVLRQTQQDCERTVQLRMNRQWRAFEQQETSKYQFLLDEATIHRSVGGPGVMHEQLQHLLHMSEVPFIDIRVLPYSAGHLLEAAELNLFQNSERHWTGCIENFSNTELFGDHISVDWLLKTWQVLTEHALSPDSSKEIVENAIRNIDTAEVVTLS